ncbi:DedA family protein [Patescibacteria group bacterium]|nr:DedA family protein [Patescibacteria group bacterium]
MSYWIAFFMILFSVLIGATILYFLSLRFGQSILLRFGMFIHLNKERLITVEKQFKKYGPLVIIFGRHIPGFRVPITIFSGISKVPYRTFIISTFISVVFWIAFYLEIGRQLGSQTIKLLKAHNIYYLFLVIIIVSFIVYILLKRMKNKHGKKSH